MTMTRTRTAATVIGASVGSGILIGLSIPGSVSGISATESAALPWIAERLFAFMAYWVVTASVVYGLLLSTKLLDHITHKPTTFAMHKDLALIALGLAGVHGTLLMLDKTVPYDIAQVFIPGLSPYQPLWVGIGQVALYLLAFVSISWRLRRRIGVKTWRGVHALMLVAFVAATLHGVLIGSDGDEVWAIWVYALSTSLVAFLLVYRLYVQIAILKARRAARKRPPFMVDLD